jgi:hypothetical protein
MLNGLDPLLGPDLLAILRAMGQVTKWGGRREFSRRS